MSARVPMPRLAFTVLIALDYVMIEEGRRKASRLFYQAAGVDFYVSGKSEKIHVDCIPNLLMQKCLALHIPLISLHTVKTDNAGARPIKTDTVRMFGDK